MGRSTVHPLTKVYKWKYSGIIAVPGVVILILTLWFSYTFSLEFFDGYSCDTLRNYMMGVDVGDVIPHDLLDDSQHFHLHEIIQECREYDRFAEPINHHENS